MMYTVKIPFKVITKIVPMKKTTVTIDENTKEQLAKFGSKGESFNEILKRVMADSTILCNKTSEDADAATTEPSEEE